MIIWQKCGSGSVPTPEASYVPIHGFSIWFTDPGMSSFLQSGYGGRSLASNLTWKWTVISDSHTTIVLEQWSSAFWTLQPFNTVPHIVVTPHQKIIFVAAP